MSLQHIPNVPTLIKGDKVISLCQDKIYISPLAGTGKVFCQTYTTPTAAKSAFNTIKKYRRV